MSRIINGSLFRVFCGGVIIYMSGRMKRMGEILPFRSVRKRESEEKKRDAIKYQKGLQLPK
jgi:hypothetical protein